MANKNVTLYIDDTSIRLLITSGKRIIKWADSPLEPGLVQNGVVQKEAEVANNVKLLFQDLKLRAQKVIVGVSGLHCLTRPFTLPQMPKEMLDEAVKREAKRLLPVPLEQLYLSWQTIPTPNGKTNVFLVAIPCQAADALFKTLAQAGIKPYLMDLKPLALARVAREANTIIVDVQPTEFDILILVDGIPHSIRTVPLPSEVLSWQKKLPMIKKDLERTIEFYNTNNPEKPLLPTQPLLVSGELANEKELQESLAKEFGYPVLPIAPPLECSDTGLDPNHYLVNMGLTLKEMAPENRAGSLATNLNVLPSPYRTKPASLTNVLAIPSIAIAVGLSFFLVLLIQNASADIASMYGELNTFDQPLQQRLAQRQALNENIVELQRQITEAETAGGSFTAAVNLVEKQGNQADSIKVAVDNLPGVMRLTSVNYDGTTLILNGWSPSEEEILSYLRVLDGNDRFSEITITGLSRNESEGMDFTLVLKAGE
jgi:type IV pilus assembly protein PilM